LKQRIKRWLFRLLGKDPEAVVVCFRSGPKELADAMCAEVRRLEPNRRFFEVGPEDPFNIKAQFKRYRIGLAPVLFTGDPQYAPLRRAAFRLKRSKILAYNARLERHHLRWTQPIASWLFLRGVPLDRIFLRPWWWPHKDRTERPTGYQVFEGRARGRTRVAILTPYFPYPMSHGGAVRIFSLLREIAREFDVTLYAFTENEKEDLASVLALAARVYLVKKPRYREPRWSTFAPPEVGEYASPEMKTLWSIKQAAASQVEYTYLAPYGGDVLVEHDVTYDLYGQVHARRQTRSSWWNWWRWHHFETRAVGRFKRVVAMSEKDRAMLGIPQACVIENGVDLDRFEPTPETPGRRLLFIGSFRHFPNIVAFRFLTEEILPLVPDAELTVVAGPDPWLHWRNHTGTLRPPENPRLRMLEFVADVRPLYQECNLAIVPTLESAGTNVKVLEALAMERGVVSTNSGCAGLGLTHGVTAWIADSAEDLAAGIRALLDDAEARASIAKAGRAHAQKHFDWRAIGRRQRALLREIAGDPLTLRPVTPDDLASIARIQAASPQASQWDPPDYLAYNCHVAVVDGAVAGFLVTRPTGPGEREILNLAVDPQHRRHGIARRLVEHEIQGSGAYSGAWFLEVRESNAAAIELYRSLGFRVAGRREGYYQQPLEAGIVMRILS
jgi:ribosomal protein S18 acetylase RimI-like enzyme/glycosyltransferase involved in cell wall biosynthesis